VGDYVGDMTPQAKNGKKSAPQGRPGKGVKCEGQIWVIFLFFLIGFLARLWRPQFLHRSTPFLRQMR